MSHFFGLKKGYFFTHGGINFFRSESGGVEGFPKSSISIIFALLRRALVTTESVHGSGCLWSSGELGGTSIQSPAGVGAGEKFLFMVLECFCQCR